MAPNNYDIHHEDSYIECIKVRIWVNSKEFCNIKKTIPVPLDQQQKKNNEHDLTWQHKL